MKMVWRHDMALHGDAFRVIAIVSQLSINNGEKLFECGYRDLTVDDDLDDL
jgi:hypothetical protein